MPINEVKERMKKFSFIQMSSNSDGKTSASGTMGVVICSVASLCFLLGAFTKQDSLLVQCTVFGGLGAGLLGYRKYKEGPIVDPGSDKKDDDDEGEDEEISKARPIKKAKIDDDDDDVKPAKKAKMDDDDDDDLKARK